MGILSLAMQVNTSNIVTGGLDFLIENCLTIIPQTYGILQQRLSFIEHYWLLKTPQGVLCRCSLVAQEAASKTLARILSTEKTVHHFQWSIESQILIVHY